MRHPRSALWLANLATLAVWASVVFYFEPVRSAGNWCGNCRVSDTRDLWYFSALVAAGPGTVFGLITAWRERRWWPTVLLPSLAIVALLTSVAASAITSGHLVDRGSVWDVLSVLVAHAWWIMGFALALGGRPFGVGRVSGDWPKWVRFVRGLNALALLSAGLALFERIELDVRVWHFLSRL